MTLIVPGSLHPNAPILQHSRSVPFFPGLYQQSIMIRQPSFDTPNCLSYRLTLAKQQEVVSEVQEQLFWSLDVGGQVRTSSDEALCHLCWFINIFLAYDLFIINVRHLLWPSNFYSNKNHSQPWTVSTMLQYRLYGGNALTAGPAGFLKAVQTLEASLVNSALVCIKILTLYNWPNAVMY